MLKMQKFVIWIQTDSLFIYKRLYLQIKYIAENLETRFEISNFEIDKPLTKGKNEKIN